jgi:hypothetical protein
VQLERIAPEDLVAERLIAEYLAAFANELQRRLVGDASPSRPMRAIP